MADVTITGLPNASTLDGTERVPMDQAGVTVDATTAAIAALANPRSGHTGTQTASTISDFATASRLQIQGGVSAGSNITITPTGSGASLSQVIAAPALSTAVRSLTTGITGASAVSNLVTISQEDYDSLPSYDPATLYYIPDSGGSSGTVTSVSLTAPTGFSVAGSPVTSSGTLALSFASGYSLPTTSSQTNWDTAFSQTRQWDGGATGLVASTGRTSLGLGTLATLSALGSITSAGAIGSTANLPVITTTGGALTVGSFGTTANTFAQGNDSRFHDSVTLSAALTPVFSLTGQSLSAVDHGADRLLFWDDSAGTLAPLTLGTNLSITGTTINASGGSGGGDVSLSGTPVAGQAAEWTNGTTIQGVAVTGTGSYVKATAPALSGSTQSTDDAVSAGTNAQGQGLLSADINRVATASANGGVTLPVITTPGRRVTVINRSGNVINVYPNTGASIDGATADTALAMGSNVRLDFTATSTTAWFSTRQDATSVQALSGAGAGVITALGIAVGSAGGPVVLNGAGGTPSSLTLTNATGLPLATGVSGILPTANGGTGVDNSTGGTANTFWARPNGSTGAATYRAIVAADIPTLNQSTTGSAATLTTARTIGGSSFNGSANVTSFPAPGPIGGTTPSTGVFTTLEARSASSLLLGTAGSAVGSVGFRNATSGTITLAPPTGALGTVTLTLPAITDTLVTLTATQTLTNKTLTSPTMTAPVLGTPASGTLTNCTGLPVSTGISGLGTGVATALAVATGSPGAPSILVRSGTAALGTTAIASGASATLVTVSAAGVLTTDVIDWGFNANPNTVTGYSAASTTGCLVITAYPTADNVNFLVSNPTAASITPGALTLNWKVTR
jgi:hypothetical protein